MANDTVSVDLQVKAGTAAQAAANNKFLIERQEGVETDTGRRKIGPGYWNDLQYDDAKTGNPLGDKVTLAAASADGVRRAPFVLIPQPPLIDTQKYFNMQPGTDVTAAMDQVRDFVLNADIRNTERTTGLKWPRGDMTCDGIALPFRDTLGLDFIGHGAQRTRFFANQVSGPGDNLLEVTHISTNGPQFVSRLKLRGFSLIGRQDVSYDGSTNAGQNPHQLGLYIAANYRAGVDAVVEDLSIDDLEVYGFADGAVQSRGGLIDSQSPVQYSRWGKVRTAGWRSDANIVQLVGQHGPHTIDYLIAHGLTASGLRIGSDGRDSLTIASVNVAAKTFRTALPLRMRQGDPVVFKGGTAVGGLTVSTGAGDTVYYIIPVIMANGRPDPFNFQLASSLANAQAMVALTPANATVGTATLSTNSAQSGFPLGTKGTPSVTVTKMDSNDTATAIVADGAAGQTHVTVGHIDAESHSGGIAKASLSASINITSVHAENCVNDTTKFMFTANDSNAFISVDHVYENASVAQGGLASGPNVSIKDYKPANAILYRDTGIGVTSRYAADLAVANITSSGAKTGQVDFGTKRTVVVPADNGATPWTIISTGPTPPGTIITALVAGNGANRFLTLYSARQEAGAILCGSFAKKVNVRADSLVTFQRQDVNSFGPTWSVLSIQPALADDSQEVTYAATVTPNVLNGHRVAITGLTGNMTLAALATPHGLVNGDEIEFVFDVSSGAPTITWDASYKGATLTTAGSTTNNRARVAFRYLTNSAGSDLVQTSSTGWFAR